MALTKEALLERMRQLEAQIQAINDQESSVEKDYRDKTSALREQRRELREPLLRAREQFSHVGKCMKDVWTDNFRHLCNRPAIVGEDYCKAHFQNDHGKQP